MDRASLTSRLKLGLRRASVRGITPIQMHVDEPTKDMRVCNRLQVRGWAFSTAAPVAQVEVLLDHTPLGRLQHGISRPDVAEAFSHPNAESSGYGGIISLGETPAGAHNLVVRVTDTRNNARDYALPIEVASAEETDAGEQPMKMYVDEPAHGTGCAGQLRVVGWAFSESAPMVRIEAMIDGKVVTTLPYGSPRPDVEAVYSHPHARNCGFDGVVDLGSIEMGAHALTVRALDAAHHSATGEAITILRGLARAIPAFPDGHYYSPVVDREEVRKQEDRIWPEKPQLPGIECREQEQRAFLVEEFPRYVGDFDYPEEPANGAYPEFYRNNPMFGPMDSRALFVMLRKYRPARMIEVGSGYSSLLTADVNRRFLGERLNFTCIEPYPPPYLIQGLPGISRLVEEKIEDVPVSEFEPLGAGDIVFIDSSHVSKTGSDVNHIVFEILPRLAPGVLVHFHDIFLPNDYPKQWVLHEGRSWNEQYLVRAMLMFTHAFEILFGSAFVSHSFPEDVERLLGRECIGGGSLWLRVTRER